MPSGKFSMDDYVPVNERIEQFYSAFPEGSLQSEIVELTEGRVTIKAYAYRKPDDPRPGIGHSSMGIPGSTPYTKGSEIENCETSSWGRAIAALGFEVKRGIASREEVSNKQQGVGPSRVADVAPANPAPADRRAILAELAREKRIDHAGLERYATLVGIEPGVRASDEQLDRLIAALNGHGTDAPLVIEQGSAGGAAPGAEAAVDSPPTAAPSKKGRTVEEAIADAERKAAAVA